MKFDVVEKMYLNKKSNYFSLERELFKEQVKENNLKILDIGCGYGILGSYFKRNQNCYVAGVEINLSAYEEACKSLDFVVYGNVESIDLPFTNNFFDVIIMGDVLEHLISPVSVLDKIDSFLKENGKFHISVPNIRNWKVLKKLIFNDSWEYQEWGILDETHLRFFTKKSINSHLKKNNFNITFIKWVIQKKSKSYWFNVFTFRIFEGFLASHIYLTITKK